jgi:hypothetical protein
LSVTLSISISLSLSRLCPSLFSGTLSLSLNLILHYILYLCVGLRLHKPCSLRSKPHTAEHATIAFMSPVLQPSALVDSQVIQIHICIYTYGYTSGYQGASWLVKLFVGAKLNGIFTILPFMIPNNTHINERTHTYKHTQTHTHTHTHTRTHKPRKTHTHKRKNEAMSREHAIMCREKQGLFSKPNLNEVNMLFFQESRPQISQAKKAPACIPPPSRTNQTKPNPTAPRRTDF